MRNIVFIFIWILASCATRGPDSVSPISYTEDIFLPINFIENKSHLAMNVNYSPVEKIRYAVEQSLNYELKNRGEAHITVLTPLEYQILNSNLSMEQINAIAVQNKIQSLHFKPICVGRGRLQIDGKPESAYYIVVDAPELLNLREKINEAYVATGGSSSAFKPKIFFPHITLGFTKRDLHFEDGIVKDDKSCVASLTLQR